MAGTERVRSYDRTSKTGKTVHVSSYTRDPGKMSNTELFKEFQTLTKDAAPDGMTPQAASNRKSAIVSEIRKRQGTGQWGQSNKSAQTQARQRVALPSDKTGKAPNVDVVSSEKKPEAKKPEVKPAPKKVAAKPKPKADAPKGSGHSTAAEFEKNRKTPGAKASNEDYDAHVARVRKILDNPKNRKFDTQRMHGVWDPATNKPIEGLYTPERTEQHKQIIDSILAEHAHVPKDHQAIMSGGLGGAGKGFVLGKHADVDHKQYLTVDPDGMKEQLIKRGMVPEVPGLLPMEHAAFIHEESSDLANMLATIATSQGMNVILDTTMASVGSTQRKVQKFKDAGYDVEAVFVDVPVEVSQKSALGRHRGGVDRFRTGDAEGHGEFGGRFVPPEYIAAAKPSPGSPYNSKNREAFEEMKKLGMFTRSRVFDNSDRTGTVGPKLISDNGAKRAKKQKDFSKTTANASDKVKLSHGSAVERLLKLVGR